MPDVQVILLSVILGAVTYRVTRFIILDTLINEQRRWVKFKLIGDGSPGPVRVKLLDLLSCPYCLSVWIALGAVALTMPFADVPMPVWTWLATCTASLAFWRYIEQD